MEANFWVKVNATKRWIGGDYKWCRGSITSSITKPSTKANELAIIIELFIPDALFEKPQLTAKIEIPDDAVTKPELNANVQDNIAQVLSDQLGINVSISAPEEE